MILEAHSRISDGLSGAVPVDQILSLDSRRAVASALNSPDKYIEFRDNNPSDSEEFRWKVLRDIGWLRDADPSQHILFKEIQDRRLINLMLAEALRWNIASPIDLNPESARAILEIFKAIDNLPVNVHKKLFPLMMSGYLLGHSTRVAIYTVLLAEAANKTKKYNINLVLAAISAALHDIGKNEAEQRKTHKFPGVFSEEQRKIIKLHPTFGEHAIDMLNGSGYSPIPIEMRDEVHNVTLMHHVRPDQHRHPERSYPQGITYDRVSIITRMVSIADAFDAMTTRKYGVPKGYLDRMPERAYGLLEENSGPQFDPELVKIFLQMKVKPVKGLRPVNNGGNLQ
jgi:response regulator RpfG family c-di-GMP phosphodiesterase